MANDGELLRVEDLKKYYTARNIGGGRNLIAHAVDDVSFQIDHGDVQSLVGESGCGKTTVARCIMKLVDPTEGRIFFEGRDISRLKKGETKPFYRKVQMIYQDPYTSLNPRFTIEKSITEPLKIHDIARGQKAVETAADLLARVGLEKQLLESYPHELSGGMRQRVAIARALAVNPRMMILDEPTSSLDVSVQAKVLNLLDQLKKEFSLTYLLITHNLGVVAHASNKVVVMYLGKIAEIADTEELFTSPLHPYTKGLLSSIPRLFTGLKDPPTPIPGEVPSSLSPPPGCRFHTRCAFAMDKCKEVEPKLVEVKQNHYVACHLY
jgi:oligopeptide transport system ATP-binding protein